MTKLGHTSIETNTRTTVSVPPCSHFLIRSPPLVRQTWHLYADIE